MRDFLSRGVIVLGLFVWGCSGGTAPTASSTPMEHVHRAPHGGALIEIGEEVAHLELVWDKEQGKLTVYALDGECEGALRLKQATLELTSQGQTYPLAAQANVLTDEKVGNSSQFEGVLPGLRGASEWKAKIVHLEIQGQVLNQLPLDFPKGNH